MIKLIRRWWNYMVAKGSNSFNERADPKVQLEQAIQEAQEQHRQLKEQAANVIANQKQTEIRLNRSMEEYEKVSANARQAVMMADDAQKKGDQAKLQAESCQRCAKYQGCIHVVFELGRLAQRVSGPDRLVRRFSRRHARI